MKNHRELIENPSIYIKEKYSEGETEKDNQ